MPIVAAVDRSTKAEQVISEAATMSDRMGIELHVIHVAGQYESTNRVRIDASEGTGEPIDVDDDDKAREYAEDVASSVVDSFTPVGRVGYPESEILEYASECDADYLVIGGRKRSPVGKVLFGSTTQAILLESDRPVVVIPTLQGETGE